MSRDLHLSPIVAGTGSLHRWGWGPQALLEWVEQAVDLGVTSFDLADVYGGYTTEAQFGDALARAPALRQRLQLVTKFGIRAPSPQRPQHQSRAYDSSPSYLLAAVDLALRALRTDRIDLLLLHRPDLLMEPDALAHTLRGLLAAGKVLHFGLSNHSASQLAMVRKRHPVATHQFEWSPLQMRALADGTLEQCVDVGIRPMIWGVLGGGRLLNGSDDQAHRVRSVLAELADAHGGASAVALACAWVMRHPTRPHPVIGSRRIETLRDAMAATQLQLGPEAWYAVWQASMGYELP